MTKPIEIEFAADAKKLIRETDNIGEAFDEVSDSLKDLARDSEKSADKLEDGLEGAGDAVQDLAKDTDRAADKISDSLTDAAKSTDKLQDGLQDGQSAAARFEAKLSAAFDSVSAEATAAGKKVGDSQEDGFRRASEATDQLREDSFSNAKEVAASFDGSAQSIAEGFQGAAAEALSGFGPLGAAAGLALAATVGVAIQKAQELAEANTEAMEKAAELGLEIYETGGKLDDAAIADKIKEIAFALASEDNPWTVWANEAETGIGQVKDALDGVADVDPSDVFKGLAGDVEASQDAYDALTRSIDKDKEALEGHYSTLADGSSAFSREGLELQESIKKREELKDSLEEATGASETAREEVDYYTQAMGESKEAVQARADAQEEAAQREKDALDKVREALEAQADAVRDAADATMGSHEANLNYWETLQGVSADIAANGQILDQHSESGRANMQSLLDLADSSNTYRDALVAAGTPAAELTYTVQAQRDAFIAQAEAAGHSADGAAALADSYGLIPGNVETLIQAHGVEETKAGVESIPEAKDTTVNVSETGTGEVQAGIDGVQDGAATVEVTDDGDTATVQGDIDALKGKEIRVDVVDGGDVATIQRDIDGIRGRDIPITLSITNLAALEQTIRDATRPRTVYVDMVPRQGQANP